MALNLENRDYRTSDLYFAAFLKASDCKMIRTERDKGRMYFIFEKTEFMSDLRLEFFNGEAKISALRYADSIRALKSICHI